MVPASTQGCGSFREERAPATANNSTYYVLDRKNSTNANHSAPNDSISCLLIFSTRIKNCANCEYICHRSTRLSKLTNTKLVSDNVSPLKNLAILENITILSHSTEDAMQCKCSCQVSCTQFNAEGNRRIPKSRVGQMEAIQCCHRSRRKAPS